MSGGRYAEAGDRVRAARRAAGWRQWELARNAKVSVSYVSALENGSEPPTGRCWTAVAEVLGLRGGKPAAAASPAADPGRALPVHPPARSHRDIPAACECYWEMTFTGRRPGGWRVTRPMPGCTARLGGAAA